MKLFSTLLCVAAVLVATLTSSPAAAAVAVTDPRLLSPAAEAALSATLASLSACQLRAVGMKKPLGQPERCDTDGITRAQREAATALHADRQARWEAAPTPTSKAPKPPTPTLPAPGTTPSSPTPTLPATKEHCKYCYRVAKFLFLKCQDTFDACMGWCLNRVEAFRPWCTCICNQPRDGEQCPSKDTSLYFTAAKANGKC
jgi:hypothetical protein